MAQDREVLGSIDDNGRVRALRGDGASLTSAARHHPEVGERERMRCAMAVRYGDEK